MIFQGVFIRIDVPKMNDGYLIISNTKIINYEKYRIDMDYMEFQEKFNVYGTNKIIDTSFEISNQMSKLINEVEF